MAKRAIVWTATAARQRREVLKYWIKRNGSTNYAERLIKLTAVRIQVILKLPESFKPTTYPETRESAICNKNGLFAIFICRIMPKKN